MKMKEKYKIAKESGVGNEVTCPSCGTKFVKKSFQQVFCKTKGGTVCKDKYWNTVDPKKRNNTTRISPANQRYYDDVILPRRERREWEEDYDPGDSEYWMNKD